MLCQLAEVERISDPDRDRVLPALDAEGYAAAVRFDVDRQHLRDADLRDAIADDEYPLVRQTTSPSLSVLDAVENRTPNVWMM